MRVKLFTLRYSATLGGFDERPVQEFVRDKELIAFREHFFEVNRVPHVACVLTWQDPTVRRDDANAPHDERPARRSARADPTARLTEAGRVLFNTLREWRAAKARDEGVPPYVIFTNRELVEIVQRQPDSMTALGNTPGIGTAKLERHGSEVLGLLHGTESTEPS